MSVQLGEWRNGELFVEGLLYNFPKKPAKNKIINFGLPRKKQHWNRFEDYKTFDWSEGWDDRLDDNPLQIQFLIEELTRIYYGCWIIIEDEEVYLNGDMYFFLQWFLLEDGSYPNFRDSALYFYRFAEICDNHSMCTGFTLLKARRLGATAMALSRLQRQLLINTDSNFGIVSNKGNNASKAFQRIVKSMGNLPVFLRPTQEGNTAPKKVLSLKEQAKRITKDTKQGESQNGLNNELSWENTDLNSYDSFALKGLLLDEGGKYPKDCPVNKYLPVVTKCLKKGARVVGKIMMPTTCNPPTDGGAEYREVWESSNQEEASELGKTKTGLYRIFIPAYIGFDGYILPSGKSVWDTPSKEESEILETIGCPNPKVGAKEFLEGERKQLENNPEDLQEEVRMNPFSPEEVFESANDRCLFNLKEQNEAEKLLSEKLVLLGRSTKNGELGRRGWFHFLPNKRVKWVDDEDGIWYIDRFLREDQSNRFEIINGKQTPTNEEYGSAGLDPIFSGDATVDKGSDACCIIRARYSSMDEDNTGKPVAMLLGRMADTDKLYEQVFAGLVYYGVKMLGERSTESWIKVGERLGLDRYIYGTKRADGSEVKGISAQHTVGVKNEHVEVQQLSALHDTFKVPFIRLIRDRILFNVSKRTDYDACMADGYALMAAKIPFKKIKKETHSIQILRRGEITTY